MLFDKKIKYLLEVLSNSNPISDGQTLGGYQPKDVARGLDMDEESFKKSMIEFEKTKDPVILNNSITFAEEYPNSLVKFEGKFIKGSDLKDRVIKRYFTKGSKSYIDIPRTPKGELFNNKDFQAIIKNDRKNQYTVLKNNPVMWLKALSKILPILPSDVRQEVGQRVETFFYFGKGGVIRQGRVHVMDNDIVTRKPFSNAFDYRNRFQAFTPKGEPIPYNLIAGGIPLDQFKKLLYTDVAKKKELGV